MAVRRSRRDNSGPFDALIPDLYDAVIEPQLWPDALLRVTDAAGIDGAHFLFCSSDGLPLLSQMSAQISDETNTLYRDHYGAIDPRRDRIQKFGVGEFLLCHREFDNDFVRRSEFYNDFCIPAGFRYMAGVQLYHGHDCDAVIGFLKRVGADPFDNEEVRVLRSLIPHLRRVAQLQQRLIGAQAQSSQLSAALDLVDTAIVVVDANSCVRHVNRAAESLLRAGDGLSLLKQRLVIADQGAARRLERLTQEAAQCAAGGDPHRGGGSALVPRRLGRRPLVLTVVPLPARSAAQFWRAEPAVAVFIADPEARPLDLAERFAQLFGLTPAEARLAAKLAAGDSPAAVAETLGLSKHTIRVQLRALMAKTDTHRQAALVRLLTLAARN
jgi:DNA-binding CsgD family transcriptional regulator